MRKLIEDLNGQLDEARGRASDKGDWAAATRLGGGGLGLHVIQFPTGTWGFVGSVPVPLKYERRDGKPLSAEDQSTLAGANIPGMLKEFKTRSWKTREDAAKAAKAAGHKVADDKQEDADVRRDPLDEAAAGMRFGASKGLLDFFWYPAENTVEIGLGGEWWSGPLYSSSPQETTLHHRKEGADPAYRPVTVRWKQSNDGIWFMIEGGFLTKQASVEIKVGKVISE